MNTPTSLTVCLDRFLEALRVRHYSAATLQSYRSSVTVFLRFLADQRLSDLREVEQEHLREYMLWLQARDYAPWTVAARIQALRRLFEHLEAAGKLLLNPCAGLPLPKLLARLPKGVLTVAEASAVLNAPDTANGRGLRDKAILEVFYSSGIRLEEMTRLTLQDIDCREGFLQVNNGKGARDRVVPLGRTACDSVSAYLQKARESWSQANPDQSALWLSSLRPHGPLKKQILEVLVRNYGRRAGIARPVTPHVWRHTCATHLVADGANIAYVQRLLAHQSLRTTQLYARTSIPEIQATHARAHPRNQTTLP